MSDRWMTYDDLPFANAPNGICRWCGVKVPRGRKTWCSKECVQKFNVRSSSGYVRSYLFQRDDGTCARCGLEAGNIERMLNQLGSYGWEWIGIHTYKMSKKKRKQLAEIRIEAKVAKWIRSEWCKWLIERGWNRHGITSVESLWDADHIIPVIEGGGQCGLDGYQTLCVPCHKAETAELAARQARKRQTQKANEDMPLLGGNYKVE